MFQGTAAAFQASLANEPILILAALITVYIVLGVLYESYIHPITILSTLPSAGVGALLALMHHPHRLQHHRADRHYSADRHRGKERHHDDRFRAGSPAQRRQTGAGGDLSGLPAAVPSHHHDHHGGAAGRRAAGARIRHRRGIAAALGISIVGGLIFSQLLTLYTTPVVYLWFDRLAKRFQRAAKWI